VKVKVGVCFSVMFILLQIIFRRPITVHTILKNCKSNNCINTTNTITSTAAAAAAAFIFCSTSQYFWTWSWLGWVLQTIFVHFGEHKTFVKVKKVKERIAVSGIPSHSYGTSLAIWDHTVLPATGHK